MGELRDQSSRYSTKSSRLRVSPLHVLECEHRRVALGQPLEEESPGREEVLLVASLVLGQPEQVREPRLEEASLFGIEDVLLQRGAELRLRRRRFLLFGNPAAHAHHVRQCPVGDALAVGEAAPAVPVDGLRDAVEVLVELPAETRLADSRDASDRDEVRLLLVRGRVEQLLDLAQLAVAADERCLEAVRLERATETRDDSLCSPKRGQALLALELERARLLVDDRPLRRAARGVAHIDRTRLGDRLHARGRVHEVARDHALTLGAQRHGSFARQHSRTCAELLGAHLLAERRDGGDEVESRPHRPLGIVLGRRGRAPDGHHRVTDELLDRPAVQPDQPPARVEVARQQLPHLLGVTRLRERREADQVGEEDGDEAAFGRRGLAGRDGRCRTRRDLG